MTLRDNPRGSLPDRRIGVLNLGSATEPGGSKNDALALEESIARISTLYQSLYSRQAQLSPTFILPKADTLSTCTA
jgi:hypothetical protein